MARLIDADELLKKLLPLFNYRIVERDDIKEIVDDMPTIEQKHGHWIRKGGLKRAGEPEAHCSNCGRPVSYYIDEKNTYQFDKWCAGCGAKMDEVTE